jgi:hypothetical protein
LIKNANFLPTSGIFLSKIGVFTKNTLRLRQNFTIRQSHERHGSGRQAA